MVARVLVDTGPIVACLTERTGVRDILTVDAGDFAIYRLSSGRALNNLLAKTR